LSAGRHLRRPGLLNLPGPKNRKTVKIFLDLSQPQAENAARLGRDIAALHLPVSTAESSKAREVHCEAPEEFLGINSMIYTTHNRS